MKRDDLKTFQELTAGLAYRPKAIYPSEMFLFYRECRDHEVDLIVESGVGFGGSTTYLDKLFPDLNIIAIDDGRYKALDSVRASVGGHIRFKHGDSRFLVPEAVCSSRARRVAILIDGPKDWIAVQLAEWMVTNPSVRFAAVHDLGVMAGFKGPVQSRDPDFRKRFSFLDDKVDADARKKHPDGPGLGFFYA